eukprot:SAG31_NODE_4162_length_3521_cov_31.856224_5_plen_92_part_00
MCDAATGNESDGQARGILANLIPDVPSDTFEDDEICAYLSQALLTAAEDVQTNDPDNAVRRNVHTVTACRAFPVVRFSLSLAATSYEMVWL